MKRLLKLVVAVALVVTLLASSMVVAVAAPAKLTLSKKTATLLVDDMAATWLDDNVLFLRAYGAPGKVVWASTNPAVAGMARSTDTLTGHVHALGYGTTVIIAYAEGTTAYATCTVTVAPAVKVTDVNFAKAGKKITKDIVKYDAVIPLGAQYKVDVNAAGIDMDVSAEDFAKYFTCKSSNETVASFTGGYDSTAKQLTFSVNGFGTTVLTLTANDNPKRVAKMTLTISPTAPITKIALVAEDGSKINTKYVMGFGLGATNTYDLKAMVTPDAATLPTVEWTSSNESIATVNQNGEVSFVAPGKVKITAAAQDGSKRYAAVTFAVSVAKADMADNVAIWLDGWKVAHKSTVTAPINTPSSELDVEGFAMKGDQYASISGTILKSSNTKVAKINNGTLELVGAGKTVISATAIDGSKKNTQFTLVVYAIEPKSINLDEEETGIYLDATGTMTVQRGMLIDLDTIFEPLDTTDQRLTYKSSNTKAVTVDKTGMMTAVAAGNAKITVTSVANKKLSYTFNVKVNGETLQPTMRLDMFVTGMKPDINNLYVLDELTVNAVGNQLRGGTDTYQWYTKESKDAEAVILSNETDKSLALQPAHYGKYVGVNVAATTWDGEAITATWESQNPIDKFEVVAIDVVDATDDAIAGSDALYLGEKLEIVAYLDEDKTIAVDQENMDAFSYTWARGDTTIATATDSAYTITEADLGSKISVIVKDDSGKFAVPADGLKWESDAAAIRYTLDSVVQEGEAKFPGTLKAKISTTGYVAPAAGDVTYMWFMDGSMIEGETTDTYTIAKKDVGTQITVEVNSAEGKYVAIPETGVYYTSEYIVASELESTTIVDKDGNIVNEPVVGETLTAKIKSNNQAKADTTATYQWYTVSGDTWTEISEANNKNYTVADGDSGKTIGVKVTIADFVYTEGTENAYKCQNTAIKGVLDSVLLGSTATATQAITEAFAGDTIHAVVKTEAVAHEERSEYAAQTAVEAATTYTWSRVKDGAATVIDGATASNYTLTAADVGCAIMVETTQAGYYEKKSATSPVVKYHEITEVKVVEAGNEEPVEITTPMVGKTLKAIATTDKEGTTLNYKWQNKAEGAEWTDITGAANATYAVTAADEGKQIRVVVSTADAGFDPAVTVEEEPINTTIATLVVTINKDNAELSGAPMVGDKLTAVVKCGEADFTPFVTFAWNGEADAKNAADYTVVEADFGKQLKVSVKFGNYKDAFESSETDKVNQATSIASAELKTNTTIDVTLAKASVLTKDDFAVMVGESAGTVNSVSADEAKKVYTLTLSASVVSENVIPAITVNGVENSVLGISVPPTSVTVPAAPTITNAVLAGPTGEEGPFADGKVLTLTCTASSGTLVVTINGQLAAWDDGKFLYTVANAPTDATDCPFSIELTDKLGRTVTVTNATAGSTTVKIQKAAAE